jgi:hypothetical protein
MLKQTVKIELPESLIGRACIDTSKEARELVTFLLEKCVQELDMEMRRQAYEAYYEARRPQGEAEERQIMADFTFADAEPGPEFVI